MRIVQLTAEDVKRLRAVSITPDGDVVVVAGRNAQGKSSVLDAIWLALGGGAASKTTSRPIRDGESKARVRLDLGDLIVERRWTEKTSTLEVSAKPVGDGPVAKYSSPQAVLDSLVGRLTFDPLAFANQDARGQLETLLSVVDLPFDPAELAERRRETFDLRTEANRNAKLYESQLAGVAKPASDTPVAEVSAAELTDELEEAIAQNGERLRVLNDVERCKRDLEEARAAAEEAKRVALRHADALKVAEKTKVPDEVDIAAVRERIAAVDETNKAVRDKHRWEGLAEMHRTHVDRAAALTESIEDIDREKAEGLAGAAMPLDGLSFDDDGVLYNGVPFSQASASEQLRVGVAIAMALNPKIRVIQIRDGSLLDSESMGMIAQLATDHDFQVWVERVDESGKVGVVIEDGAVA